MFLFFFTLCYLPFHSSVIAIKGTSPLELLDIIADVRLWSESVLIQWASSFLPTISIMSSGMIANIISGVRVIHFVHYFFCFFCFSIFCEFLNIFPLTFYLFLFLLFFFAFIQFQLIQNFFVVENSDLDFHRNIVRYVHCTHAQLPQGWQMAVTGHSLGGGLATIVGTTLGIPSIAFSPPGILKSRYKFEDKYLDDTVIGNQDKTGGMTPKRRPRLVRAAGKSLNLIPHRDLVPMA